MSQMMDLMLKYPMILPTNEQQMEFQGFLPINGTDYEIHIKEANGELTLDINQQLQQFEPQISYLINSTDCTNVVYLLDGLKSIIASKIALPKYKNLSEIYRHVLSEYTEFKEFYINIYKSTISQDLSEIKISHLDECNRLHDLVICTDFDNKVFKVLQHSFPEKKDGELFQPSTSLKVIYEKFIGIMEKLQEFFYTLDNLDQGCWILDPEKPTIKDCYRRIGLDNNVSIIVTFDPWSNTSIPDIKFLGPERLVENYRQKVAKNLINWNNSANAVDEILNLLELSSFPKKPVSAHKEEIVLCDVGECCICFSSRLNDKLPEIICQNASCEQVFHSQCLYQWLISINAKQSFNELHGQCPNCEKHISCPL